MKFLRKKYVYGILLSIILIISSTFVLVKTYIIPEVMQKVEKTINTTNQKITANKIITDTSYKDENIAISLDTIKKYDTTVYVADIQINNAEYLKTALAQDTFGTNITEKTSSIATNNNAILAVNGDYYGANRSGYVIKNGTIYRSVSRGNYDDLVIMKDGSFEIINESAITTEQLLAKGVVNTLAFGPTLIENGEIVVNSDTEVGRAMADNPRTAIGIIDDLHYIIVVSDGRTSESKGLSLLELAEIMQQYNVKTAYNLDGGGSSTMVFNGKVINNPTTNGNQIKERAVSDIVYIGY